MPKKIDTVGQTAEEGAKAKAEFMATMGVDHRYGRSTVGIGIRHGTLSIF